MGRALSERPRDEGVALEGSSERHAAPPRRREGGAAPRGDLRIRARRRLAPVAAFGLSLLVAACSGDGRTPLVLYSPHGRDLLELFERTYEEQNPEVDVRWLDMGSQEVYDRVRSEAANPQADVWFGGPSTIFARGAAEGLLAPHRPGWADALPEGYSDPEDRFHAVYRTAPVILYNSDAVPAAEAPADWDDLLDPRWNDQILIRDAIVSRKRRPPTDVNVRTRGSRGLYAGPHPRKRTIMRISLNMDDYRSILAHARMLGWRLDPASRAIG